MITAAAGRSAGPASSHQPGTAPVAHDRTGAVASAAASVHNRSVRLLPADGELGLAPVAWLAYLGFVLLYPFLGAAPAREWALTLVAIAAFLVLYFAAFWRRGARLLSLLVPMAGLGLLVMPWNPGASAFVIYAAGFAGRLGTRQVAATWLAALVAAVAVEAALLSLSPATWIPGVVVPLLVGIPAIHFADQRRRDACLRMEQADVARLAQLEERERIARDLHDLLGQTLSMVALKSELAAKLGDRDPARAARESSEVAVAAREALAEVRRAVGGYRLPVIEEELARARLALGAAGVRLEADVAALALPPLVEGALALGLREAVTNVVRHAAAGLCQVRLIAQDGQAILDVRDDGRGGSLREGAGLAGMRERLAALGGQLECHDDRGTRLRLRVPLGYAA